MLRPVSIVTVTHDTYFFVRLLVEKVRELIGQRSYEIVVVDRGSRDGTREWLRKQGDVRLVPLRAARRGHGHDRAAELGASRAQYETIVLLDSDAHPMQADWLELTADRLDSQHRLAGPTFHVTHRDNPHGWYIHPHFMVFSRDDLGRIILLERPRGSDLDTGEAATIQVLAAGLDVVGHPLLFCDRFAVGHPHFPTLSAGVFHAWYGTRLVKEKPLVDRETQGAITRAEYLRPLKEKLRAAYRLDY